MDASSEVFWPVLFTLFAVILAAVITGKNRCRVPSKSAHQTAVNERDIITEESSHNNDTKHHLETNANKVQKETIQDSSSVNEEEEEVCRSDCTVDSSRWEEDSAEYGITNALKDYTLSPDAEEKPLRYMAGMLRASQLEKMMSKEELEEEQRVQRDQLAAIFQLLRDKQETFGDLTDCDLEEQLKLYSF